MTYRTPTLSKSKFVNGLQCLKMLWWRVKEPKAPELAVDPVTQQVFDNGTLVGQVARERFAGGVLLDYAPWQYRERCDATRAAMAADRSALFEASFSANGVFVAVDILERDGDSHRLIEVKSTTKQKSEHIPDVAIQLHVLRAAGVGVSKVEVMHLNRDCHFPDLSNLFTRVDVTDQATALQDGIPDQVEQMQQALAGALPTVDIGDHCHSPYECPFKSRCWPEQPKDHVSTLYRIGARAQELLAEGFETIHTIPDDYPLGTVAARQLRSVKTGKLIVEPGLREALVAIEQPTAFLDFETIGPPIPVWDGCAPYDAIAVLMSCHVLDAAGNLQHHEYLAEDAEDPRAQVAEAVVRACEGSRTILAYNASFERGCIERMAEAVPTHRAALTAISERIVDLLPIIRNHVYHPDFGGSFSIKKVLPALVPSMTYSELEIGEGATAQAMLERLLLREASLTPAERETLRRQLLVYCKQDTLAMVRLLEVLRGMC